MKPYPLLTLASVLLLAAMTVHAAPEPDARPATRPRIGQISGDFKSSSFTPLLYHFVGHIRITSEEYDLAAEDIKIFFLPKQARSAKSPAADRATADGGADGQVDVHVRRPLQSEAYEILSDHAVYLPDPARPGYGRMDFTGHVTVNSRSGFLVGPGVLSTDHATILLGPGDDYPQLSTGASHVTATPAQ